MNDNEIDVYEDEELYYKRLEERRERRRQLNQRRIKRAKIERLVFFAVVAAVVIAIISVICVKLIAGKKTNVEPTSEVVSSEPIVIATPTPTPEPVDPEILKRRESIIGETPAVHSASENENTRGFNEQVESEYAILIDTTTNEIVRSKNATTRIVPASMTKVLTVLTAAQYIKPEQLDDKVKISIEACDYSYVNDCSNVGFSVDEEVTVRDLFYGTILPSGGDAAYSLAEYVAGDMEAFVELMNKEIDMLGLSSTSHFSNPVGIYSDDLYTTPYDMCLIMWAAEDNEFLHQVLEAHTYTTTCTTEHPEGITISNWFLRRIEDKDSGLYVAGGKTGFVVQSGNCAVSYGEAEDGHKYICCTAKATSGWKAIYDHVEIYNQRH